jgi:nucleoside-diphosphate-sugar epimerase
MNVFVTGASGWTAAPLLEALHLAGHSVIGFDLAPLSFAAPGLLAHHLGDIANFKSVRVAIEDASPEAVIHLAIAIGENDYLEPGRPFAVNVQGTYHVFEAARQAGVRKFVLISSAPVHLPQSGSGIRAAEASWESSPREDHLYDLTKRLQETIARDFSATFGLEVVVLRAGHIVDGQTDRDAKSRDLADLQYCRGGWVCRHDLAQACLLALGLDKPGYTAFHIIGASEARRYFDIDRTEKMLGLKFTNRFENYFP